MLYDCKRPLREQLVQARKNIEELKPLVDSFILSKKHSDRDMVVLQRIKDRTDKRYCMYIIQKMERMGKLYSYRWIRY